MKKRIFSVLLALVLLIGLCPAQFIGTASAASQVYYNVDFSAAVLKSSIGQRVKNDCGVVSMATVESYLYGATTQDQKNQIYNAVISANGGKVSANWPSVGFVKSTSVTLQVLYDQLAKGYPVIVHRASGHYSVVCGYTGSTSSLQQSGFQVVDVYRIDGSSYGGTRKMNLTQWLDGSTLDQYIYRKNGISFTSFSGIRFAVNHPQLVHPYGNGHGVYGRVVSNYNLTSVKVTVTKATDGSTVYSKTVTPNAKSYSVYNLDSEMTFASWEKGAYYYVIIAKDSSGASKTYCQYFTIGSTWPSTAPTQPVYTIAYNANGGSGTMASESKSYLSSFTLRENAFMRDGYTFKGWYVQRSSDKKWYSSGDWRTEVEITSGGYEKKLYQSGETHSIVNSWMKSGGTGTCTYTFYAVWEAGSGHTHSYTAVVTAPTCTEAGYTTYTCSCGDSYVDSYIDALGHDIVNHACTRCDYTENCPSAAFDDLDTSRWYHEGIDFVLENGYMAGTDKGFQPDTALTREMLAQILYAKEGKPEVEITGRFPDEDTSRWYAAAIEWAAENGYIAGYGNGNFGVGDAVTREQIAVILYAYEGKPAVTDSTALDSFPDAGQVSSWAKTAMVWAVENGLITGNAKGELMPKNEATRATFAVIFRAYLTK